MVETLLKANADDSGAALYAACEQGFIAIAGRLIDAGADINGWAETVAYGKLESYADRTALHGASKMGRVDIVDLLLRSGATVKLSGRHICSPLRLAIEAGHLSTAQRLMQAIEVKSRTESLQFIDALYAAVKQGYETIVKSLLETGTSATGTHDEHRLLVPSAAARGYTSILRLLLDAGASMDEGQPTALQAAVRGGHD